LEATLRRAAPANYAATGVIGFTDAALASSQDCIPATGRPWPAPRRKHDMKSQTANRRRAARARWPLAALPLLGAIGACAPSLPELSAERQWAQALARLSMFAVYPAREDVMVGDLLLYVPPANHRGPEQGEIARFLTTRLASAPCRMLMEELGWQGRDRPRLQPIPVATVTERTEPVEATRRAGGAGTAYHGQGDLCAASGAGTRSGRTVRPDRGAFEIGSSDDLAATPAVRLQRAQVPVLAVARLTEGQLSGQGIVGGVGASLGLAASGNTALRIELKNIEMLRLDPPRVMDLSRRVLVEDFRARQHGNPERGRALRFQPADMIRALEQQSTEQRPLAMLACAGDFDRLARLGVRALTVNDVMYAREINYAFSRSSAAAMQLAADLRQLMGLGVASIPPLVAGERAGGAPAAAGAEADAATRARELLHRTRAIAGAPVGGELSVRSEFAVSSAGELSMKVTTARPLAVGFGAALQYPIEEVMIPTHAGQIQEARAMCQAVSGQPMSESTERVLRANFDWVGQLAALDGLDAPRRNLGVGPSRLQLPAIFPNQR
jgi:hypothetical protein